ncbi:hypothetical protein MMC30_004859 [Trapelia coarctata]|nr:hypothetical protein [Trapelia coarctata]
MQFPIGKRLSELKSKKAIPSSPNVHQNETLRLASISRCGREDHTAASCPRADETNPTEPSSSDFDSASIHLPSSSSLMHTINPERLYMTPAPVYSVYSALYNNGRILGLLCSYSTPCKSSPALPDVPLTLQPTPLQLLTIHFPWIDRFPFPRMREHMINWSALIDEEEFLADLFTVPSFALEPGSWSWDAAAWEFVEGSDEFRAKWGNLFA